MRGRIKHWRAVLWALVCLACVLALWGMCRGDQKTVSHLNSQLGAQRWETEEKPYAMASVFLPEDQGVPQDRMGEIYLAVENALTAGGVSSESYPWLYGASYESSATLKNGTASCEVELTAIAGDFFRIHPMPLLSGWYIWEEDLMHDRIVLDRQTAWNLYYSMNVAGQYLTVNGVQYQVAAVVDTEPGEYNELAAEGTCRAWVFSDSPALRQDLTQGAAQPGYTCVEMILPQPVKDFAAATLKNALKDMIPETTAITDNSGRFSLKHRWEVLRHFTTRGISQEAVNYPYWENAARLTENHLALRLIPEGILGAVPAISLVILLLWLNHRRTWGLHSFFQAVENAVDRKHQRDYYAQEKPRERRPSPWRRYLEERGARRRREKALGYEKKHRGSRRR